MMSRTHFSSIPREDYSLPSAWSAIVRESDLTSISFLCEEENAQYEHIPTQKQIQWCMGRYSAKRAAMSWGLEHQTFFTEQDICVRNTVEGVPYIVYVKGPHLQLPVHLSVSHTRTIAVSGVVPKVGARGIGIDIESVRYFQDETVRSFLTEREYLMHLASNDRSFDATLRWCLKEAYLKAQGVGLRTHPRQVEIKDFDTCPNCVFIDRGVEVPVSVNWTIIDGLYILVCITL